MKIISVKTIVIPDNENRAPVDGKPLSRKHFDGEISEEAHEEIVRMIREFAEAEE